MKKKFLWPSVAAAAMFLAAGPSWASGSEASGSTQTDDAQAYNMGKGVYAQKLACKGCLMAGKSLDAAMAKDLLSNKNLPALSSDEKQALMVYLNRRFRM